MSFLGISQNVLCSVGIQLREPTFMVVKWQPTPVLLPGKSHGQRSLAGCSPWGLKDFTFTFFHPSFRNYSVSLYKECILCGCLVSSLQRGKVDMMLLNCGVGEDS